MRDQSLFTFEGFLYLFASLHALHNRVNLYDTLILHPHYQHNDMHVKIARFFYKENHLLNEPLELINHPIVPTMYNITLYRNQEYSITLLLTKRYYYMHFFCLCL